MHHKINRHRPAVPLPAPEPPHSSIHTLHELSRNLLKILRDEGSRKKQSRHRANSVNSTMSVTQCNDKSPEVRIGLLMCPGSCIGPA
eukprot:5490575-Amphidinium_carterae.1